MSKQATFKTKLKAGDTTYSTRGALTCGISKHTVTEVTDEGWVRVSGAWYSGKQGGDFHATLLEAQEKARALAERALKNLDKKRVGLEAIARDGAKVTE